MIKASRVRDRLVGVSSSPHESVRQLPWKAAVTVTVAVGLMVASAFAAVTDTLTHAPPATGLFAYNGFVPGPSGGASYIDPVFGERVLRVSADHGRDDIYARNMWWSADARRYVHRTYGVAGKPDGWDVIDVSTGAVTHSGLPFGYFAADGGFDPVNPDVLYYLVQDRGDGRGEIHQVTLGAGGTWTDAVYFTAPAKLGTLGGTLNWLDAAGRYMLVRYGTEPSVHLFDRQNLAAGPYANALDARNTIDLGGYTGISPDGRFLVAYDDRAVGFGGMGQGMSWRLDHTSRAIAASPAIFWSLCGDHGSLVSASDGRTYMITYDCYSQPGLWRVDVSNDASGLDEVQQQNLPNNRRLLAFQTWNDFGHVSTAASGVLQDWAFIATEDAGDTFNSGAADGSGNITPWHVYRQEIIAVNVITGEVRRLAHHRSRSIGSDYYSTPRISSSWDGSIVGFASNFNQPGGGTPVVDIYAVQFMAASASTYTLTAALVGTGRGSVTSSPVGIDCGSTCTATYDAGTRVTLAANPATGSTFAGWSGGGCSGTGSCALTLGANTSVTATFNMATFQLTVKKVGNGVITSSPTGINCGGACTASYSSGTLVTLTARAASHYVFAGWSGACSGRGSCTVSMTADRSVTAMFTPR